MLDTLYPVETPEGIELNLRLAGPAARAQAWAIDFCLRAVIYILFAGVLALFGRFGTGLILLVLFVTEWFYPVLFELYKGGQTPGKAYMQIRVLHEDGSPVGWAASIIRNLLRAADFLPFCYGFGLFSMLFNRHFQRLGDLAAGTIVVYQDRAIKQKLIPDVKPISPPILLDIREQQAIIAFAERAPFLNIERAEELAGLLQPLTGAGGQAGINKLYQIAAALIGKK